MDYTDIKEMIFYLSVVLNKLAQAKKDAQKHTQGREELDSLSAQVDRLEDTLADVSYDLDTARDDIYKLVDMLEDKMFKMTMDELSEKVTTK